MVGTLTNDQKGVFKGKCFYLKSNLSINYVYDFIVENGCQKPLKVVKKTKVVSYKILNFQYNIPLYVMYCGKNWVLFDFSFDQLMSWMKRINEPAQQRYSFKMILI